jgi:glycosyltransferase involved in cell wall biosynthesis
MPVYNGGRFLRAALAALLSQDYSNFEIIISDNASTDETAAICQEYALADLRIKYYGVDESKEPAWNFARVYELSRGEYFMWAAHDDIRHPQYLSRCVEALEQNPRALFCCTGVKFIDVEGLDVTDAFGAVTLRPAGATPLARLRALARSTYWVDFYSLFRTRSLVGTRLRREVWGGDVLFVAALCLRGEVAEIPEPLFSYRLFFDKSGQDVAGSLNVPLSWIHLTLEMLKNIWCSPLGFLEKAHVAWMFVIEFCIRNKVVSSYIREEGFSGVRYAFTHKHPLRALAMAALAVVPFAGTYFRRARQRV